jgi:alpha-glucosidase (family GH31 glycosyl hydrolase)
MAARLLSFLTCSAILLCSSFADAQQNPKYDRQGNSVVCGAVRFQFLTPSLGRAEYSPSGKFVDAPTAVVLKRDWPAVDVALEVKDGVLTARTSNMTLTYTIGTETLTRDNLRLSWKDGLGEHSWAPGDSDKANLGGISYSLDGTRKDRLPTTTQGILSRSGYFILDDTRTPVWDSASAWIAPRAEKESQDFYWFIYGDDYAHGLQEYAMLCGNIPMIPRYALGAWITDLNYEYLPTSELVRDYAYSDENVKSLVTRFRKEQIPLDVLVLDFAWHRFGWMGGFDWSPIFPDPKGFLDWTHADGVKVSLNDHPGYGRESTLSDEDSHAAEIRRLLGLREPAVASIREDISKGWKFRADSVNRGLQLQWESLSFDDAAWTSLNAGASWEEQGFEGYDGIAWYRKKIQIPSGLTADSLFLVFSGVDDEYDLFLDGSKVAHYGTPGSSVWNSMTYTNILPYVGQRKEVLVVLRVNDWGGGGGVGEAYLADAPPGKGVRFNLAVKKHAEAYMSVLHNPLIDLGVDFWWVDGGMGSCEMEGLNSQLWTNRLFYDFTEQHTNRRAFIFSRYGGWGNHRYPAFFTGDTYAQWEVLAYQVPYTAQGGNVLMPYITHDIGGFIGRNISFDLYARWLQFGVFSPLVRLHSAYENPRDGNVRMPWTYGKEGIDLARDYFALRYRLIPYIYTYCRLASDSALPLLRPLYLEYPRLEDAYAHPSEYFFGKEILVAPIVDSMGERDVYLPPGQWFAYFTDSVHTGPTVVREKHSLQTMPLFVRSGSIIPGQPVRSFSDERALDTLLIDVYGTKTGKFSLYEDDGLSLQYQLGRSSITQVTGGPTARDGYRMVIGPTRGDFNGQSQARTYELKLHGFPEPKHVRVDGMTLGAGAAKGQGWSYDGRRSTVRIRISSRSIRQATRVAVAW